MTCNSPYYMALSLSRQDERNPVLWLASRAGKMALFCPLAIGTTRCIPEEKFPQKPHSNSFIDHASLFGQDQ